MEGGHIELAHVCPTINDQRLVLLRAFYFKVDISNIDSVKAACDMALGIVPKGSLAGAVHTAAITRSVSLVPTVFCRHPETDAVRHFIAPLDQQHGRFCQGLLRQPDRQHIRNICGGRLCFRCKWV